MSSVRQVLLLSLPIAGVSFAQTDANYESFQPEPRSLSAELTTGVKRNGDTLHLTLRGRRTNVLQPLERHLALRAQVLFAHALCNFTPKPDLRLSTSIKGFQIRDVNEIDGIMEIQAEIPFQTPRCEVFRLETSIDEKSSNVTRPPSAQSASPSISEPSPNTPAVQIPVDKPDFRLNKSKY